MGAALGCSCETKDDQAEVSLVQPITNYDGKKQMREVGMSPDDSEINPADGSVLANGNHMESGEQPKEDQSPNEQHDESLA